MANSNKIEYTGGGMGGMEKDHCEIPGLGREVDFIFGYQQQLQEQQQGGKQTKTTTRTLK